MKGSSIPQPQPQTGPGGVWLGKAGVDGSIDGWGEASRGAGPGRGCFPRTITSGTWEPTPLRQAPPRPTPARPSVRRGVALVALGSVNLTRSPHRRCGRRRRPRTASGVGWHDEWAQRWVRRAEVAAAQGAPGETDARTSRPSWNAVGFWLQVAKWIRLNRRPRKRKRGKQEAAFEKVGALEGAARRGSCVLPCSPGFSLCY